MDVAGKQESQNIDMISKEKLDLLKKRREMKATTQKESIAYTELLETIRKCMKMKFATTTSRKSKRPLKVTAATKLQNVNLRAGSHN